MSMMRSVASNEPVRKAIKAALQQRLDGCGAEVLEIDRSPELQGLVAHVRWGPFRVSAVAKEGFALARGGVDVYRQLVLDLETAIGGSIENAIGDFARRAIEDRVASLHELIRASRAPALGQVVEFQAVLARIASLEAEVQRLRRPWYQKLWSWLTTYERRSQ